MDFNKVASKEQIFLLEKYIGNINKNAATKTDLEKLRTDAKTDLEKLISEIKTELSQLERKLEEKIHQFERKLMSRIHQSERRLILMMGGAVFFICSFIFWCSEVFATYSGLKSKSYLPYAKDCYKVWQLICYKCRNEKIIYYYLAGVFDAI